MCYSFTLFFLRSRKSLPGNNNDKGTHVDMGYRYCEDDNVRAPLWLWVTNILEMIMLELTCGYGLSIRWR